MMDETTNAQQPIFQTRTLTWNQSHASSLRAFMAGLNPEMNTQELSELTGIDDSTLYALTNASRRTIQESRLMAILECLRARTGNSKLSIDDVFGLRINQGAADGAGE